MVAKILNRTKKTTTPKPKNIKTRQRIIEEMLKKKDVAAVGGSDVVTNKELKTQDIEPKKEAQETPAP